MDPTPMPPYLDFGAAMKMNWCEGDIVINGMAKSGTHWGMNIVYQLLSGGHEFESLYDKVPWIEYREYPGQEAEERIQKWDKMQGRRPFKAHIPAMAMPLKPFVKYLIIVRDGKEVVNSFLPFINGHSDEFRALWKAPPKFANYDQVMDFMEATNFYHAFCLSWWEKRNEPNVMLVHFADMKKDLEGSIRKIAKFLEIPIDESKFPKIMEYTSFKWMAEHEPQLQNIPSLVPFFTKKTGTIVRKGEVGVFEEQFTSVHHARWDKHNEKACPDPVVRAWLQSGGPLPCKCPTSA